LLFSGDLQGNVFKLADAMAEKNLSGAESLLQLLLGRREKPLLIFFMLARHYRLLLQARCLLDEGLPPGQFASTLEVPPFVARKLQDQACVYTQDSPGRCYNNVAGK
jgi:DNA polymerase III subunit delta